MDENPDRRVTPWQSVKALGFVVLMLGPGIPFTVLLWRLALGG